MTIALATFEAQIKALAPDWDDELAAEDVRRCVREAVQAYGVDFPDDQVGDVTGDAGRYYPLTGASAVLSAWSEGASRITRIEYPAATIASDEAPTYLDQADWDDAYWASGVRYLYLPHHAPATTETMRVTYSAPYGWSTGGAGTGSVAQVGHGFSVDDQIYLNSSSVYVAATDPYLATHQVTLVSDVDHFTAQGLAADAPENVFFAICYLGACALCRKLATKYGFIGDSTVNADSASHQTKSDSFAKRADDYCAKYRQLLGLSDQADQSPRPAGEFVDFDTRPEWPSGRRWLFRGGR